MEHWESMHSIPPRMRLPSPYVSATRDILRLLDRYIRPGMRVLEIGCAPGKHLAYVAKVLGAEVAGIDYAEVGLRHAKQLFSTLAIDAELRCENVFESSLEKRAFDVVYSIGVVEHFDDPAPIIRVHAEFLRPGGTGIVAIPNYGGIYGRWQTRFDPDNLAIHNLDMMHLHLLRKLAPLDLVEDVDAFPYGHFNLGLVSLHKKLPRKLAATVQIAGNLMGLMQPFQIKALCPMLVMEMTRKRDAS